MSAVARLRALAPAIVMSLLAGAGAASARDLAAPPPPAAQLAIEVARQPRPARERLDANVAEILKVMAEAGRPISEPDRAALAATAALPDADAVGRIQEILNGYALAEVHLDDEAWFSVSPGSRDPADRPLVQWRWSTFLVKVHNEARVTGPLEVRSIQAVQGVSGDVVAPRPSSGACEDEPHGWAQWFRLQMIGEPSMPARLHGAEVEYLVVQLCSLDAGDRAAELTFYLGGGQVSQGHYGAVSLLFRPTPEPGAPGPAPVSQ
ncbi:hypothetical protein [Hansschlegelia beijingensis]|uniref:Uncharacterized protein n=1 Tax=Hansschlegelia beijingensis TaxID=1133344 RepID=A0A7W6D1Q8_9HYPH|nr:hypothetical protein [Hansschlegelia beijingensis]MBB3971623.1 hypothetical protein [Hansschlegelia beijingensis]